jgi:ketosteroid isomerase-like protein
MYKLFIAPLLLAAIAEGQPAKVIADEEKAFAAMSVHASVQQAFVKYFSDSAVSFHAGKIYNGKEFWKQQKPDSTYLFWSPVYADISLAKDLGFTSGPWQLKVKRTNNEPDARGFYNSVWRKEKDGQWKVVIDIGVGMKEVAKETDSVKYSSIESESPSMSETVNGKQMIMAIEKAYLRNYPYLGGPRDVSGEARFYRPGKLPLISSDSIQRLIRKEKYICQFEVVGGDMASSNDMGYVYGNVKFPSEKNGVFTTVSTNYMRIWKKEKNTAWKIVLDVIAGE